MAVNPDLYSMDDLAGVKAGTLLDFLEEVYLAVLLTLALDPEVLDCSVLCRELVLGIEDSAQL